MDRRHAIGLLAGLAAAMALIPETDQFSQFLRLAFLRSPNFLAGSTGWTINQDGSAEFNNITIRNGTVISGVFLLYSASPPAKGNLILAFAPVTGGTDSVGNVYPQGFNFGVWDATGTLKQHFGINSSGDTFLVNNAGKTIMHGRTSDGATFFYNTSGESAGNQIASIAAAGGTNPAGDTFVDGVAAYSGAIFAQLHNGVLVLRNPAVNSTGAIISANTAGIAQLASPLETGADVSALLSLVSKAASSGGAAAQGTVVLGPNAPTTAGILEVQGSQAFTGIATPASPPAGDTLLFSDTSGFLRMLAGLAGDTNAYFLGANHLFAKNVSQVISSTTPATITGLSLPLGIGTYRIRARLVCTQGLTLQSQNFRFTGSGGLATSAGRLTATSLGASSTVIGVSTVTGLATDLATGAFAAGVTWVTNIDGWYQVSAAGIIALQASDGAAGNQFTVVDGTLDVEPAI